MLTIYILDDNAVWIEKIDKLLTENLHVPFHSMGFSDPMAFLTFFEDHPADIVFADIQMPERNGIDVAKEIRTYHPKTQIIFTSAYTEYIQDVFSVDPVFYLLKPFQEEKFKEALLLALHKLDANCKFIEIMSEGKLLRLPVNDILYARSERRKVFFHTPNGIHSCDAKLDDIEKLLPPIFVRSHKSYLVNMEKIRQITATCIELFVGDKIPMSKARYSDAKKTILQYWESQL